MSTGAAVYSGNLMKMRGGEEVDKSKIVFTSKADDEGGRFPIELNDQLRAGTLKDALNTIKNKGDDVVKNKLLYMPKENQSATLRLIKTCGTHEHLCMIGQSNDISIKSILEQSNLTAQVEVQRVDIDSVAILTEQQWLGYWGGRATESFC